MIVMTVPIRIPDRSKASDIFTIPAKLKLYFLKLLIQRKMSVTSALLVKSKKFQSTGVNSCICKGRCTEAVYDAGAST